MTALRELEKHLITNIKIIDLFPSLSTSTKNYANLSLREPCKKINKLFTRTNIENLQSILFSSISSAPPVCTPYEANQAFIRGRATLTSLEGALGQVAAEGVIPYPPGIMSIAPGERWTAPLIDYLFAIQKLIDRYPEFAPHIQGLHYTQNKHGSTSIMVNVLNASEI